MIILYPRAYCNKSWLQPLNQARKIPKLEKPKIWVLGNVIMKAHAKSQEAISIRNTQKSRGTVK